MFPTCQADAHTRDPYCHKFISKLVMNQNLIHFQTSYELELNFTSICCDKLSSWLMCHPYAKH